MTAMDERERVEGIEVPGSRLEFETLFGSEGTCRAYLERVRWPDGFVCPNHDCGGRQAWLTARGLHRCTACGRQTSATAGTMFAATRKPLRAWFEVLWRIAGRDGVSAEALQTALSLGSYQTAWVWLHKVRRAMALVAPERLTGIVELDVFPLVCVESSLRRTVTRQTFVAIALEVGGPKVGRVRLARLPNSKPAAVERFIGQVVAPGAMLRMTVKPRPGLVALGYRFDPAIARAGRDIGLPRLVELARLLGDWIVGTHHGAVRRAHLDFYLAEFAFRFNERGSPRGLRFFHILEAALKAEPRSGHSLVGGALVTAAGQPRRRLQRRGRVAR
jgi:hypothetical protein